MTYFTIILYVGFPINPSSSVLLKKALMTKYGHLLLKLKEQCPINNSNTQVEFLMLRAAGEKSHNQRYFKICGLPSLLSPGYMSFCLPPVPFHFSLRGYIIHLCFSLKPRLDASSLIITHGHYIPRDQEGKTRKQQVFPTLSPSA